MFSTNITQTKKNVKNVRLDHFTKILQIVHDPIVTLGDYIAPKIIIENSSYRSNNRLRQNRFFLDRKGTKTINNRNKQGKQSTFCIRVH